VLSSTVARCPVGHYLFSPARAAVPFRLAVGASWRRGPEVVRDELGRGRRRVFIHGCGSVYTMVLVSSAAVEAACGAFHMD
jgi:hypothetical protein